MQPGSVSQYLMRTGLGLLTHAHVSRDIRNIGLQGFTPGPTHTRLSNSLNMFRGLSALHVGSRRIVLSGSENKGADQ